MQIAPITELTYPRAAEPLAKAGGADAYGPATSPESAGRASGASGAAGVGEVSFGDIFGRVIDGANQADAAASQKVDALARGVGDDLHGTMIAVKEADISVKLVASIRNKLLDAFSEIWKTSV